MNTKSGAKYSTFGKADTSYTVNPKLKANFFSKLFLSWCMPMIRDGNQRQLDPSDMWELEIENTCAYQTIPWNKVYRKSRSILRCFFSMYWLPFIVCGFAMFILMLLGLVGPIVLNQLVQAVSSPSNDVTVIYRWIGVLLLSKLAKAFLTAHCSYYQSVISIRFSTGMKGMLFEKSMRLSTQSRALKEGADINNLYTSDMDMILWAMSVLHNLWILPLQIVAILYLLYSEIGYAAFAGLGIIVVVLCIASVISFLSSKAYDNLMSAKDNRMQAVKEIFASILIVKLNAWEEKFHEKINIVREKELGKIWRVMLLGALSIFMFWGAPLFVSTVSFAVYTLVLNQTVTSAKVFTSLALFRLLQSPLRMLPDILTAVVEAAISVKRINEYLELEEKQSSDNAAVDGVTLPKNTMVHIDNATLGWDHSTPYFKNISLNISKGEFVVIHGKVGSGKSSLCSAILGEMHKTGGKVYVNGSVAYCSQQAWIQNLSVRDSILFGSIFDAKKYSTVVNACGLIEDFKQFPAGDHTEIGQKGVNMSGGQKSRIALARACYSDADIIILDAPLAAIDSVVQKEIMDKCLVKLLSKKTVLLVTHNLEIISSDNVTSTVSVEDGTINFVKSKDIVWASFEADNTDCATAGEDEPLLPLQELQRTNSLKRQQSLKQTGPLVTPRTPIGLSPFGNGNFEFDNFGEVKDNGTLIEEESRQEGRVSKSVFMEYFNSLGGIKMVVLLFCVQLTWQSLQVSSDLWLGHWSSQDVSDYIKRNATSEYLEFTKYNLSVYALLAIGSACMVLCRSLTVAISGLKASRFLFDKMTSGLLKAPMKFFDANPIGRIVNRYSEDISNIDSRLPYACGGVLAMGFSVGCSMLTSAVLVQWYGLLLLPILYVYIKVGGIYLQPSREMMRLWKVTTSPALSFISESNEGAVIVRAFGEHHIERLSAETFNRNDANSMAWYCSTVVNNWFSLLIQLMGTGIVVIIASSLTLMRDTLSPGLVGLAFNYALMVDMDLADVVQNWSWLEISMVSPERVLEYCDLDRDGETQLIVLEPEASWPSRGEVQYENVSFRYKDNGDLVLKDLNFSVLAGEKIGIVGRTGAGKSSLTMTLFRINELASGRILVDGKDIAQMSLKTLRKGLSIIPQNPVLFKGTLRNYLDPFDEHTDAELWRVLEKVSMKQMIEGIDGKLSSELQENGENFSVGERQMLCMGRALLDKSKIVIFDEATAAIDHETDQRLQKVIACEFKGSTVLTIAHRLDTVAQSDRIMVLDAGRIVEFGPPRELVKQSDSIFYDLAKEGGVLDELLS